MSIFQKETDFNARILVVGCGSIGRRHARVLQEIGVSNLAVCDPAQGPRQAIQHDLSIKEGYADLEEALQHGFEAVFICSPPAFHVPQARLAIEAGCDVFMEKPLSDQMEGVNELIALADKKERLLMVGLCMRYHQGLLRVKQLVDEGAIGRLVSVRAMVGVYLPNLRPGVDYRQVYIAQPGGGVTLDYLHEIDFVQWIVNAPVGQVFAFTDQLSEVEMQADDTAEILLKFNNNVLASIHLDVFQRAKRRQSEFMGTTGTIIIDLADWRECTIQIYRADRGQWETETVPMERDDLFLAEDRAFLRCVATRENPPLDGRIGQTSLRIALAAIASSEHGYLVQLEGGLND